MARPRWRVGILGAGVNGCAIAARLGAHPLLARGRGLLLVDRRDVLGGDFSAPSPRVFALTRTAREFLALPSPPARGMVPVAGMQVWRDGDAFFLNLPFARAGCVADQHALLEHLQKRLKELSVPTRAVAQIQLLEAPSDRPCVVSLNGEEHEFDLLVNAEGGSGGMAASLGLAERAIYQHQCAIVCRLLAVRASAIAMQKYFRDEVIGLLPQEDCHLSLVWSVGEEYHDRLMALSEEEFVRELNSKLAHNRVQTADFASPPIILGAVTPRLSFPLTTRWLASPVHNGVVFAGDAAHSIHPMLGQGLNIGLAEGRALCQAISEALARGEGPAAALSEFEAHALRRFHTLKNFIEALRLAYYPSSGLVRTAVGLGVRTINASSFLRDSIIDYAN